MSKIAAKMVAFRCPPDLIEAVEERKATTGQTFTAVIVEALRTLLDEDYRREFRRQLDIDVETGLPSEIKVSGANQCSNCGGEGPGFGWACPECDTMFQEE